MRSFQGGIEHSNYEGLVSPAYSILKPNKTINRDFYKYYLKTEDFISRLNSVIYGIRDGKQISYNDFSELFIHEPPLPEQQKIASILSTWDKVIELKEKLIGEKKKQKKGIMQKLLTGEVRLPGFDGEWKEATFRDCFDVISVKKHQIKSNEYLDSGKYPVVDQGKKKIIGFSDNSEKVFKCPTSGVIVFGDHTRELKFIDFDFIVGADGTQVLNYKDGFDIKYLYYLLQNKKIPNTGYNRHFKYIKEMLFEVPKVQEQETIAYILTTADKEIFLLEQELEALKQQKKGLMQLLLTGIVRVNTEN